MATPKNQRQMEAHIQSEMMEMYANLQDAVYGMLHPRFVRCDFAARTFESVIQVQSWMRNGNNVMHGGVIATVLDGMGGLLVRCYTPTNRIAPTCNLSVSYLRPIQMDAQLHVRMRATHAGNRLLFIYGEAFLPYEGEEQIHATSTATYIIVE